MKITLTLVIAGPDGKTTTTDHENMDSIFKHLKKHVGKVFCFTVYATQKSNEREVSNES